MGSGDAGARVSGSTPDDPSTLSHPGPLGLVDEPLTRENGLRSP